MPYPIQALPKGLVGFLDLNTSGAGPPQLADQLVGTLDLLPFFALYKREALSSGAVAAGTATGDFAFSVALTVPQNEAWYVVAYNISAAIPLGLTAQIAPTYQRAIAGGNTAFPVGPPVTNASSALASLIRCHAFSPFWLPPASFPGGITMALSAATAFNAFGNIEFVRFRL